MLEDFLYADDMYRMPMQRAMEQVSQTCDISQSAQKDRAYTPTSTEKRYNEPTVNVNGQQLKIVDKFTYLGSTLSRAVHIDDEVTARIAEASMAFGRLRANVWERKGIKLKVYKAVVLPASLYACDT